MRVILAREERGKISTRTRTALDQQIRRGEIPGQGRAPYAYQKQNGTLVIYEPEAAVVRRIFGWSAEGVSAHAIARMLNEEGVPPPLAGQSGRPNSVAAWWASAIWERLRDSVYCGRFVCHRSRSIRT